MSYQKDPLYQQFLAEEQAKDTPQVQSQPKQQAYEQDPLYQKFLGEEKEKEFQKKLPSKEKFTNMLNDFSAGSNSNFYEYGASINKVLDTVSDFVTQRDTKFFEDNQKFLNKKKEEEKKKATNKGMYETGMFVADPLNLTPAGIFTKGTKAVRIAKSVAGGAVVGAGTMAFKNYGDETKTQNEKNTEIGIGAGFVAGINGIIAGVTKGRISNAIDPDLFVNKPSHEVVNAIMGNPKDFGLSENEAQQVVSEVQKTYPKVQDEFKVEQAGFPQKPQEPNFRRVPQYPPMSKEQALSVLAKEADKKRVEQGLQPIYSVNPKYAIERVYPQKPQDTYLPNFVSGDVNKNFPTLYSEVGNIEARYQKVASHPRLQELLQARESVLAKDSVSPTRNTDNGYFAHENNGNGYETTKIPPNRERNYNSDFQLTKQDIYKLYTGRVDDDLLSKLETDLGTLDNHPDYAKSFNSEKSIDYKSELEKLDNTDVKMSDADWEEANSVFSKGIDNVAVGTYAGVEEDENGNITFDPEKFILGLGGYTAVKTALKNKTVQGELKKYAQQAIEKVDFNPEVNKKNGINSMFVGAKGSEQGSFSDVATKKTMSPVKSKAQKEMRGIYNVTYNGKNSTEVRKADGELIELSRGNLKYGAEHIKFEHMGNNKDGKSKNGILTDVELLQLGEVIRNGKIEQKPKNKHQYTYFNEAGERFRAIVGKNDDGETVVSYYSNRREGSHNAQPTHTPNKTIIPQESQKPKGLIQRIAEQKKLAGLPEKGRKVYHPDREKQYYLGDSGTVYFQRGNGQWREMPNEEIRSDIKFISENGVNKFREKNLSNDNALKDSFAEAEKKSNEDSYKMEHTAPLKDDVNSRADDVSGSFSDDIYSKDAQRLHGHGNPKMDAESMDIIKSVKGKPESEVTIYRAIPDDIDAGINPKDWVTTSKEYAKSHGDSALNGKYKIVEAKVKAKDLYTDGNSIHEWGYDPITDPAKLGANGMHSMAGGFAGGADSLINQRDYNQDGEYDYKDLLAGVVAGTISINALKKMAPKLFDDGAEKGGMKAGLFAGSKAKGFDAKAQAGKTFDGKYDTLERFEIDDSKATIKATGKELNKAINKKLSEERETIVKQYESGTISIDEASKLIDDIDNRYKYSDYGSFTLGDVLDHKELFANYPKASDMKVSFIEMPKGANAYYDKKENEIVINTNMSNDEIKSSLLHELQHSIQKKEGFARGGSEQEFNNGANKDSFDMYKRLAGEIEARDVQARADYTAKQRKEIAPYSSEDIAHEDAIMRFNNENDDFIKNMSEEKQSFKNKAKEAKAKGYEHIINLVDKETKKEWGDATSNLKRLFTDTLGAKYHELRENATSSTNGMSVKLERLHNVLSELSDTDKVSMHNYITGEESDISDSLRPLADNIKNSIDDLSKQLIDLDVLSQEQYDEWAGHYIHRNYEKHFFQDVKGLMKKGFKIDEIHKRGKIEEISATQANKLLLNPSFLNSTKKAMKDGGQRLRKLPNGKYELRRDWTKEEREAMGEITDISISAPETLMRLKRMADNANFMKNIEGIDDVVLKDTGNFSDEEISAQGFTKVPNSPKFGVLAGKTIRKDVLDDLSARNDELFNTFNGSDGALGRIWKNYLSLWKKSKTVWNAPSHLNNFMSNTFLMHLSGMRADEVVTAVGKAGKMMLHSKEYEELLKKQMLGRATKGELSELAEMSENLKYFIEAKEGGLLGRSQLNDILQGNQKQVRTTALGKLDKFTEDAYHNGDAINRIAMYSHLRGKLGMSVEQARKAVLTIMPDYSKPMPKGYRVLRDTGVSPFISWSYYTMPAVMKMLGTKQGAKKATLALGTLAGLEYALTGGDVKPTDNIPFIDTNKPEDFKGRRFGVSSHNGKVTTLKTDRWIPYVELLNPINFLISNVSGVTTNAVVNATTANSAGGMINPYYGRPITYKNKKTSDKAYDYIKYLSKSYVPLPAQAYSGWDLIDSLARSNKNRKTNKVIVPRSTNQNILKQIGLNSLSYSKSGLKEEQRE